MASLYRADDTVLDVTPGNQRSFTLAELQAAVGGYIELLTLSVAANGDRVVLFVNEDGKAEGLPVNLRATALWHRQLPYPTSDMIVGPALLCTVVAAGTDKERTF